MRRSKFKSFRRACRILREVCPPVLPVKVRRRPLKGLLGYCIVNPTGTHFIITIDSDLSWDATWLVLVHEWAHARCWREGSDIRAHDSVFGLCWAEVYKAYVYYDEAHEDD